RLATQLTRGAPPLFLPRSRQPAVGGLPLRNCASPPLQLAAFAPPLPGRVPGAVVKVERRAAESRSKAALSDKETLLKLYREMLLIRRFEEKTAEMYQAAKIGGFCHLNIGEE